MKPVTIGLILLPVLGAAGAFVARDHSAYVPRTRVYYMAAEDIDWNYAPLGVDPVMGRGPMIHGVVGHLHGDTPQRCPEHALARASPTQVTFGDFMRPS
jgi:hypothetical protein